jgi:hypothetical protein
MRSNPFSIALLRPRRETRAKLFTPLYTIQDLTRHATLELEPACVRLAESKGADDAQEQR